MRAFLQRAAELAPLVPRARRLPIPVFRRVVALK
jgi:hypothetical protein